MEEAIPKEHAEFLTLPLISKFKGELYLKRPNHKKKMKSILLIVAFSLPLFAASQELPKQEVVQLYIEALSRPEKSLHNLVKNPTASLQL